MQVFSWLADLLGLVGGCLMLFAYLELHNGTEIKSQVHRWLNGTIPFRGDDNWASLFVRIFDGLFDTRFISLRFIFVSFLFSLFTFVLLLFAWATLHPIEAETYFGDLLTMAIFFGVLFAIVNLIPDYISNCQTRYILGRLVSSLKSTEHVSSFRCYAKWLAIDLFLTTTLSVAIIVPLSLLINELLATSLPFSPVKIPKQFDLIQLLTLHSAEFRYSSADSHPRGYRTFFSPPYGAFLYTTFFTSIWLWLYSASGLFIRLLHRTIGPDAVLIRAFNFDRHPLWAQGGVCAILLGSAYVVVSIITFLL